MSNSRVPPQSLESEQAVLGSVLLDEQALYEVLDVFEDPAVFYREAHRTIFQAMLSLFDHGHPIDQLSLAEYLSDKGQLESVGGAYAISKLLEIPSAANVAYYTKIIHEKYVGRRGININTSTVSALYEGSGTGEILERQVGELYGLIQGKSSDTVGFDTAIKGGMERAEKVMDNDNVIGLSTGIQDLDTKIMGIERGDKIIIGGRPSNGKSTLALNIAITIASADVPVGLVSTETTPDRIAYRALLRELGSDLQSLPKAKLSELPRHAGTLAQLPIFTHFGSMSESQYRAWAKAQIHKHAIGLLIVDYIQEMRTSKNITDPRHKIDEIAANMKLVAEDTKVPLIIVSQLSRRAEGVVPQLDHLRETGYLEQVADKVILIVAGKKLADKEKRHYGFDDLTDEELEHIALVNVCKVRDGSTGLIQMYVDPASYRYRDMAHWNPSVA